MQDGFLMERNGKAYVTARAHIISDPSELREMAFSVKEERLNPNFLWITGRYAQGDKVNDNGQFWTTDDLKGGEYSVKYTPLNVLHEWDRPVGVFVETKLVHRGGGQEGELLPEIQALSALWAQNFPNIAEAARDAHQAGNLWYSMECIGESKQCLVCDRTFEWAAKTFCEHMEASAISPRRLINPLFQGGALIFPPTRPGWSDADIEEVARVYADRIEQPLSQEELDALHHLRTLVLR